MATITILPETNDSYRARAGDKESTGRTAGEALDALAARFEDEESGTLVIVQNRKVDQFFNAAQQERLTELIQMRKAGNLSPEEESELESLVEAELDGAQRRVKQKIKLGKGVLSEGRLITRKLVAYFMLTILFLNTIYAIAVLLLVGLGSMDLSKSVLSIFILLMIANIAAVMTTTRSLFPSKKMFRK